MIEDILIGTFVMLALLVWWSEHRRRKGQTYLFEVEEPEADCEYASRD